MQIAPILSIVTPSYNQGQFLVETIESVIGQSGDFHIDYIIVDGGSTDNSVEIIRHYDALLKQGEWPISCKGITYRWLSERDRGQTDALAKGFRMVNGEILAWLNSDDIYLPGALQTAAAFFRNNPGTGLLYGECTLLRRDRRHHRQVPDRRIRIRQTCLVQFHLPAFYLLQAGRLRSGGRTGRIAPFCHGLRPLDQDRKTICMLLCPGLFFKVSSA